MSKIFHAGLSDLLSSIKKSVQTNEYIFEEAAKIDLNESLDDADVFIIGPTEQNIIKLVQTINLKDKHISILVLIHPETFQKVKQTIQFAPFVGKNVLCIAYTENLDIAATLKNAILRTRQRRSFSTINKTPQAITSIAASSVKVEDFGTFLEEVPIGALLIDEENRIHAINKTAKRLFNADDQNVYELNDFFPKLTIYDLKVSLSTKDTSKVLKVKDNFFELHLSEVKDEQKKTQYVLLVSDITEQKRKETALMESEALFRFLAEAMPQKLWTADAKGYRDYFNHNWLNYTGLSLSDLKGWGWASVIHPDDREKNIQIWKEAIASGNDFSFEHRLLQKDGAYRWHLVRGVARKDVNGKVLMWVGTNTDIHDHKTFAEELERRVKERTFELEKSNSELEQFVYVTSHDLQEPLRKIRMFTELLKSSLTSINSTSEKYLDKVSATALRMSILLKELLQFTQINKQEQFEKTDLNEIVEKALVDLELFISEKGAVIKSTDLPVVQAIPVQMHQLFYNLINNALKFSKPGISPVIEITSEVAEKDELLQFPFLNHDHTYYKITVKDNGIGFDQNYAEQIFHIFQRLHNRTEYSGTGIGLALCKKVVTNHYGAIYASSLKGEGATFYILIPSEQ